MNESHNHFDIHVTYPKMRYPNHGLAETHLCYAFSPLTPEPALMNGSTTPVDILVSLHSVILLQLFQYFDQRLLVHSISFTHLHRLYLHLFSSSSKLDLCYCCGVAVEVCFAVSRYPTRAGHPCSLTESCSAVS